MPRLDHAKRQKFLAYYALEELRREKERQEEEEEEEYALLLQRAAVVLLLHDRRVKQERARAKQQRRKRERRLALARYKYHKLVYNNPDRRRVTLRASSLVPVHRSPAMQLLLSGDDDAFIMSMGVDHRLFQFLLDRCTPIYNTTALTVGARAPTRAQLANRKLSCDLTLALTLTFLHSVMRQFRLGQMFGLTPGSVSQYLFFGKCMLSTVLKSCRQAQVYWPTPAEQDVYATRVAELYPLLEGVCMSVDGLMLRTLEPLDIDEQAKLYSGWKSGCYISNLFAFAPSGRIVFAAHNFYGSQHDSTLARESGFYDLVASLPPGKACAADSAFVRSGNLAGKIFRPSKQNETPVDCKEVEAQTVSFRQSAEWGMRAYQASCPRLLVPLPYRKDERAMLMELATGIYQLRTEFVGINQLRNVYDIQEWQCEQAKEELPRYRRGNGMYFDTF